MASLGCRDFETGSSDLSRGGTVSDGGSTGGTSDPASAGAEAQGASPGGSLAGSGSAPATGASPSTPGGTGTGGTDAGEVVEPLQPSELDGLALWLTAGNEWCVAGSNHEVTSWVDRSGYHNDARERPGTARPKFLEITLTGHPTVRFDGAPSGLSVVDHESLHFGEGDFAYVVVARLRNDAQPAYGADGQLVYAGSGSILSKLERIYPYKGIAMFANYPTPDYDAPAYRRLAVQLALSGVLTLSYRDHVNDDVFRVYTARRKAGSDIEIRINGVLEGRSMISGTLDVSAASSELLIGGWDKQPFSGDISEIVAVRGSLEDRVLHGLEKGLLEKHRL